MLVPAKPADTPGMLAFVPPPTDAGRYYRLTARIADPDCPAKDDPPTTYWLPSGDAIGDVVLAFEGVGNTTLETFAKFGIVPGKVAEVDPFYKWVTELVATESFKGKDHYFRWETDLAEADGALWQASILPFPKGYESDPTSPQGLIASADVTCKNCEFHVDLSPLASEEEEKKSDPWYKQAGNVVLAPIKWAGGGVKAVWNFIIPGGGGDSGTQAVQADLNTTPVLEFASDAPSLFYPTTFHFRVIPTKGGKPIGKDSNEVLMFRQEPEQPDIKIVNCALYPNDPVCPTPEKYEDRPYKAEILSYHGWLSPSEPTGAFEVAETTTIIDPWYGPVTYTKGQLLKPPDPPEPSFLEVIVDFVADIVNWASEAYADLKKTIIKAVASVTSSFCGEECVGTVLDMTLMYFGIPPEIPNFDQLVNDGMDYLAEQAVQAAGVPGPLQDMAKDELKKGMKAGLKEMQYAFADDVSWLPKGVPVIPNPESDYQPPSMKIRVTRDPNIGPSSCDQNPGALLLMAYVTSTYSLSAQFQDDYQDIQVGQSVQLYQFKNLPVPVLAPGEYMDITLTLKPAYPPAKTGHWYSSNDQASIWSSLYYGGKSGSPELSLGLYNQVKCVYGKALKTIPHTTYVK